MSTMFLLHMQLAPDVAHRCWQSCLIAISSSACINEASAVASATPDTAAGKG